MSVIEATERTVPAAAAASEARRGVGAMLPLIVGYAPFALVLGAAIAAHRTPSAGWAGIWLVLGGSAHLATLRALDDGAMVVAIVTGLVVNARLVVYSASLVPLWRRQPTWFRLVGAALLIDPTWAAAQARATEPGSDRDLRRHYLGAALTLSLAWCLMISAGMAIGSRWSVVALGITVPLCLVALVAPRLSEPGILATVAVAVAVVVVGQSWPAGSALAAAAVAGAVVGAVTTRPASAVDDVAQASSASVPDPAGANS